MFVTTANTLNILPPLLDRMEVIRLSGYTEDEKVNISQKVLIPKQSENNGREISCGKAYNQGSFLQRSRHLEENLARTTLIECIRSLDFLKMR